MGSYRLGELIDRGAMGEVWHARHRLLARPAAIKLIRPELLSGFDPDREAATVRRFLREADAAASLRSPHSVQLYDFGVTREREMYLVMELLDGVTLEHLVRRFGPQPAGRVAHILDRPAARWPKPISGAFSTATSSPQTSISVIWDSSSISSRWWTSGWPSTWGLMGPTRRW